MYPFFCNSKLFCTSKEVSFTVFAGSAVAAIVGDEAEMEPSPEGDDETDNHSQPGRHAEIALEMQLYIITTCTVGNIHSAYSYLLSGLYSFSISLDYDLYYLYPL